MSTRYILAACAIAATAMACSDSRKESFAGSPTAPTALAPSAQSGGVSGPMIVNFPPRNDTVDFRRQLENKYAGQLGRPSGQVYVDHEGDAAWIGEYERLRTNGCDHN